MGLRAVGVAVRSRERWMLPAASVGVLPLCRLDLVRRRSWCGLCCRVVGWDCRLLWCVDLLLWRWTLRVGGSGLRERGRLLRDLPLEGGLTWGALGLARVLGW